MNPIVICRRLFSAKHPLVMALVWLAAIATPIQSYGVTRCCGCCRQATTATGAAEKSWNVEKLCCVAHQRPAQSTSNECSEAGTFSCNCRAAAPAVTVVSNTQPSKSRDATASHGEMLPFDSASAAQTRYSSFVESDARYDSFGGRTRIIIVLRRLRI